MTDGELTYLAAVDGDEISPASYALFSHNVGLPFQIGKAMYICKLYMIDMCDADVCIYIYIKKCILDVDCLHIYIYTYTIYVSIYIYIYKNDMANHYFSIFSASCVFFSSIPNGSEDVISLAPCTWCASPEFQQA